MKTAFAIIRDAGREWYQSNQMPSLPSFGPLSFRPTPPSTLSVFSFFDGLWCTDLSNAAFHLKATKIVPLLSHCRA